MNMLGAMLYLARNAPKLEETANRFKEDTTFSSPVSTIKRLLFVKDNPYTGKTSKDVELVRKMGLKATETGISLHLLTCAFPRTLYKWLQKLLFIYFIFFF